MIDFRYHLVSLVSVFLALAVGVVLGAGPLRGEIADSLSNSVEQLRQEKDQLRSDLTVSQQAVENRDQFTDAVLPGLVAGRLSGRSVALVTLPGIDKGDVDPLIEALGDAGASVTAQVEVSSAWTDPDKDKDRRSALLAVRPVLQTMGLPATLDAALGRALLLSPTESGVTAPQGKQAQNLQVGADLLKALEDAGLVNVRQAVQQRAQEVVMLAPPVALDQTTQTSTTSVTSTGPTGTASSVASTSASAGSGASTTTPPTSASAGTASTDAATDWLSLAGALDAAGSGAVVAGPASATIDTGLLAAIRGDGDTADRVSTVDSLGSPMGSVMVVMALQEQYLGRAGAYGFGRGADAILPESTGVTTP